MTLDLFPLYSHSLVRHKPKQNNNKSQEAFGVFDFPVPSVFHAILLLGRKVRDEAVASVVGVRSQIAQRLAWRLAGAQ